MAKSGWGHKRDYWMGRMRGGSEDKEQAAELDQEFKANDILSMSRQEKWLQKQDKMIAGQ